MLPITSATLRATTDGGGKSWFVRFVRSSDAKWFSRRLYLMVVLCAIAIVANRVIPPSHKLPANVAAAVQTQAAASQSTGYTVADVLDAIMPFIYGLLGALVFLLKSAHGYIAERSFDLYRVPEYYNRMVLGFMAGGVVLLFWQDAGSGTQIGANAVAFLVGYNTDYLFQTIERVANAVFPKTGSTDHKATAPGISKVDIPISTVKKGSSGNGSVVLTGAATGGGVPVALSGPPEIKFLVSSVSVGNGATTANFTFNLAPDAAEGKVLNITAMANGTSASASVTVG
jgi:hypothetical protein